MNKQFKTINVSYELSEIALAYENLEADFSNSKIPEILQCIVDKQIEDTKQKFDECWKEEGRPPLLPWSDGIEITKQSLDVYIRRDKSVSTSIHVAFRDSENSKRECYVCIPVDLPEYEDEMYIIAKTAIDKHLLGK